MKNVLEKKDYDLYRIQLPPSMIVGGRRKRYLITELGKQHPRFSDEYCFDSRLRLGKKGFSCDVVVMQKFRLAELKKDGEHRRVFISEGKKSFFDTGGQKLVFSSLFRVGVCIVFAGIAFGMLISMLFEKTEDTEIKENKTIQSETGVFDTFYSLENFFADISDAGGKISWFEWNEVAGTESFSAEVKNTYPEIFSVTGKTVSYSVVSYSDEIPVFTVNVKNIQRDKTDKGNPVIHNIELENSKLPVKSLFPQIRSLLKTHSAIIVQENQNTLSIVFYCPRDPTVFTELCTLLETHKMEVSNIRIQATGARAATGNVSTGARAGVEPMITGTRAGVEPMITGTRAATELEVRMGMKNSICVDNNHIFTELSSCLNLFQEPKTIIQKNFDNGETSNLNKQQGKVEAPPGVKTGEINYADGSKMVFYKTAEGKIVKRKEFR